MPPIPVSNRGKSFNSWYKQKIELKVQKTYTQVRGRIILEINKLFISKNSGSLVEGRAISFVTFNKEVKYCEYRLYEYIVECMY